MQTARTAMAVGALALLAACGLAPAGNAAREANAAHPQTANAVSPTTAVGNETAGKSPNEPITEEWFAGRWSTDSDCSSIATFSADRRFVTTVGERGTWSIADNRLTLVFQGQSATIPMERIDERTVDGIGERGRTRQYRC